MLNAPAPPLAPAQVTFLERLLQLPKFYGYKDVLTIVFAEDEDAFLDAYCDGTLPQDVRRICEETAPRLDLWLQRRICRLCKGLAPGVR